MEVGYGHVLQDRLLALFSGGVPGVQLNPPQFDLLVPGATAVLSELVGRPGVNARLPQVPEGIQRLSFGDLMLD